MLFVVGSLFAQKEVNPLGKIAAKYSPGSGVLETKLKYSYYNNFKKRILLDSMSINYIESTKAIYTNYEGEEIVSFDGLTIVILNSTQSIALAEGKKNDDRLVSLANLSYLINQKGAYKLLHGKEKAICRVYNPSAEIDSLDILYNAQTFLISKICLYYKLDFVPAIGLTAGAFLEIEYVKYNKSKSSTHPSLNISSYIVKTEQGWTAKGKYSSYEISN